MEVQQRGHVLQAAERHGHTSVFEPSGNVLVKAGARHETTPSPRHGWIIEIITRINPTFKYAVLLEMSR